MCQRLAGGLNARRFSARLQVCQRSGVAERLADKTLPWQLAACDAQRPVEPAISISAPPLQGKVVDTCGVGEVVLQHHLWQAAPSTLVPGAATGASAYQPA